MTKMEFDFSVDIMRSILWQYNDAEKLIAIFQDHQDWINDNVTDFWMNWYRDVYNLDTANEFGLQIWAIILDVKFSVAANEQTLVFGFGGSGGFNFSNGGFKPYGGASLTTEQKRMILKMKYRKYISRSTIDEIQATMQILFPDASVIDNLDMSISIYTGDALPSAITYILQNYDVLPIPAGVRYNFSTNWVDEKSTTWVDESSDAWTSN